MRFKNFQEKKFKILPFSHDIYYLLRCFDDSPRTYLSNRGGRNSDRGFRVPELRAKAACSRCMHFLFSTPSFFPNALWKRRVKKRRRRRRRRKGGPLEQIKESENCIFRGSQRKKKRRLTFSPFFSGNVCVCTVFRVPEVQSLWVPRGELGILFSRLFSYVPCPSSYEKEKRKETWTVQSRYFSFLSLFRSGPRHENSGNWVQKSRGPVRSSLSFFLFFPTCGLGGNERIAKNEGMGIKKSPNVKYASAWGNEHSDSQMDESTLNLVTRLWQHQMPKTYCKLLAIPSLLVKYRVSPFFYRPILSDFLPTVCFGRSM